jgi:hypothetical protein
MRVMILFEHIFMIISGICSNVWGNGGGRVDRRRQWVEVGFAGVGGCRAVDTWAGFCCAKSSKRVWCGATGQGAGCVEAQHGMAHVTCDM